MTSTTYTASYTTPTGKVITATRQTATRTYTHAAVHRTSGGEYQIWSFHSSQALAAKGSSPYNKPVATVPCYKIGTAPATPDAAEVVEVPKSTKCQGRPAAGQGARIEKKCSDCNFKGKVKGWRAHNPK